MLTPHPRHFPIAAADAERILRAHGLGGLDSAQWATRGMNNPTLLVNDRYAIRFDGLGWEGRSRFHGEKIAYDLLHQHGIPAPQALAVDDSRALVPYDYLLMTQIPGTPLIEAWPTLTPAQQERVARQAGAYLAQMHSIPVAGYGRLRDDEQFPTWYAFVRSYVDHYSAEAVDNALFDEAFRDVILALFARHEALLNATPPRLVHWDYHFENLLQQDGEITGIIDFEWAWRGDPAYDFKVRDQWERTCPGSRAWLYAGYAAHTPLNDDHELRVTLYTALMLLDYAVDARTDDEQAADLAHLRALVGVVE